MSQFTPNQRALVRTAKLGFVFQSFNLLPRTSALQQVIMPLDYSPQRPGGAEALRLAHMLLDRVGLADRTDHEPSQMSGGQQQRVAIARSLVNRPALLLADEPTGNLDSHTSVEILRMFQQLNAEGITVILVTHDPKVAAFAHRTIRHGRRPGRRRRTPPDGGSDMEHRAPAILIDERPGGNGAGNGDGHAAAAHSSRSAAMPSCPVVSVSGGAGGHGRIAVGRGRSPRRGGTGQSWSSPPWNRSRPSRCMATRRRVPSRPACGR